MNYLKEKSVGEAKENVTQIKRKSNLDILKIIACFLVIVNHTNSRIFSSIAPSLTWFISITYFFLCKIAVPIFVMVSGAVLLGKEEKYGTIFRKRILRTIIVIVLFSFVYYINDVVNSAGEFSIFTFLYTIVKKPITNAYWYLYMYLGLLFMLPILRKLVQGMKEKDYIYGYIIWIIFIGILPIISHYTKMNISSYFALPIFTGYIVYFLMGYFIENILERKYFNKKVIIFLTLASILCITLSVVATYYEENHSHKFMDNVSHITISIPSVTVFYICKYVTLRNEEKEKKTTKGKKISTIAICTFGIYLLSDLLIKKFNFVYEYLIQYIHKLPAIFILEIIVFIVGFIITWLLRKLPVMRKLI